MPKIASMSQVILSVAALAVMSVSAPAAEPPPAGHPAPAAQSATPKGFGCHDKALTGSGPLRCRLLERPNDAAPQTLEAPGLEPGCP